MQVAKINEVAVHDNKHTCGHTLQVLRQLGNE